MCALSELAAYVGRLNNNIFIKKKKSVTEMRMLRWMNGNILGDRIRNVYPQEDRNWTTSG